MGFFDRFNKKGDQGTDAQKEKKGSSQPQTTGKRIKKYTSDGKPIYEE